MNLPSLYLNGFPKSGLHLAELMVKSLFDPVMDKNWLGTNAWDTHKKNLDKLDVLACVKPGQYIKGHSGWSKELERMLTGLQIGMVLVYRDLRDVVVSQAYHILSDNENLKHPAREIYSDNHKEVMKAVISGLGEYDGIFERWANYEPWLKKSWVLPVKYEDMVKKPEKVVNQFFFYVYGLALKVEGKEALSVDRDAKNLICEYMVKQMRRKSTVTYRKGKTKQWRYEFTPEIANLFKEYDKDNVLVKLRFEKDRNWN